MTEHTHQIRVQIRVRRRPSKRQRQSWHRAGEVSLCPDCIIHFGDGYGPLAGAKLGAVVRYHRRHPIGAE